MDLNEYIAALEKLRQEVEGTTRVVESAGAMSPLYAIRNPRLPSIETLQVKTSRESYEKIYSENNYGKIKAVDSGIKVILL